jgi:hypothetical protein
MPCYDSGQGQDHASGGEVRQLRERLDDVTNLLCALCRGQEERGQPMAPELADWWARHKADDERRRARESEAAKHRMTSPPWGWPSR